MSDSRSDSRPVDFARPVDLVAMGRVAVDLYAEQIGAPLAEAQTFRKYLGGCAGNVAVGAARLDRAQEALKLAESDRQAARSLVAEGTGKRLMDRARTLAAQIERNELRLSSSILSQSSAERRDRLSKIYFTEAAALLHAQAERSRTGRREALPDRWMA